MEAEEEEEQEEDQRKGFCKKIYHLDGPLYIMTFDDMETKHFFPYVPHTMLETISAAGVRCVYMQKFL